MSNPIPIHFYSYDFSFPRDQKAQFSALIKGLKSVIFVGDIEEIIFYNSNSTLYMYLDNFHCKKHQKQIIVNFHQGQVISAVAHPGIKIHASKQGHYT